MSVPGGLKISKSLRKHFDDLAYADGVSYWADSLEIVRFGLNYDFIKANNLSWIDNFETSSGGRLDNPRHKEHHKPYVQNYLAEYIDEEMKDEFERRMDGLREETEERVLELMKERFEN